ncbi:putative fatty acid amide hydrolase [Helianthus annuus]|nr:putative fatty acid amide hydrolase [Helianthus annuus]KAJ0644095.1 putative fatty acid amide hydrolase [Helianthus annuus]
MPLCQVEMGKKKKNVMLPANQVDLTKVKYDPGEIEAPNLSGLWLRIFVMFIEMPFIGPVIVAYLKKPNKLQEVCLSVCRSIKLTRICFLIYVCVYVMQMLRETVIPEPPMFRPEFPPQGFNSSTLI